MKYIPVFHPSGVAMRSKSVPDGFVTKDFTLVYVGWALPIVIVMVESPPFYEECFVNPLIRLFAYSFIVVFSSHTFSRYIAQ